MKKFTYSLQVQVKAMNEGSAKRKLKGWLEPSLAMKKNSDITAKHLGLQGGETEDVSTPAKKSSPKRATKKKKVEPEYDDDWDEDFEGLDWDEQDEEDEESDIDAMLKSFSNDDDDDDEDW